MSVLVTCWTGVLRIDALEARFPGGLEGFGDWFRGKAPWNTSYHHDDHLAAVSFLSVAALDALGAKVKEAGLVPVADGSWHDLAYLDQVDGLAYLDCAWLETAPHPDGLRCWLAGADPGELVMPDDRDPSAYVAVQLSESAAAVMRGVEGREPLPEPGSTEATMAENVKRHAMMLRFSRDPSRWRRR